MGMKAGTCAVFVLPVVLGLMAQGASSCKRAKGGVGVNGAENVAARAEKNAAAESAGRSGSDPDVKQDGENSMAAGMWGGAHVRLEVSDGGEGKIEFDCAHGSIEKIALDRAGNFNARGLFVQERGGPVREGEKKEGQPARFSGKVAGKTMTLRVVLTGADEEVGTFTLTHGRGARLTKCL